MRLYNARLGRIEDFAPQRQPITIYVCGITPYDTTHLGHAFTYASFDVLIRYLEYRGHVVRYVQNVTDIDDDILRKAKEVGESWMELGNRWTAHFIRDMKALNIRPPDNFPRATDVISEITAHVEKLLEVGVAYESEGSVYFQVGAWEEFGKLSRIPRDQMLPIANERGNRPDDLHKRDPLDFVLWQAYAPGEPAWESRWGLGRPGWHIECSTMATHFLGDTIDIHGGGADLIFPHHECEIAQAECATAQKPFVRFWLHTAMVRNEGEKMSKSLGNLVMVRDLLSSTAPDGMRLYLASHHYRRSWSHNLEELEQCEMLALKLRKAVKAKSGGGVPLDASLPQATFVRAMDNDMDSPSAMTVLEHTAKEIMEASHAGRDVQAAQEALRAMAQVFGLILDAEEAQEHVTAGWNAHLERFAPGN